MDTEFIEESFSALSREDKIKILYWMLSQGSEKQGEEENLYPCSELIA